MIITYNDRQMLELWRLGAGLEPAFADSSVERFDALDIDRRLQIAMRAWYIDYLVNGPAELVPVDDLTKYTQMSEVEGHGYWLLNLMCETARITEITLKGYGPLTIIDAHDNDFAATAWRLANRMTRHGSTTTAVYRRGTPTAIVNVKRKTPPVILSVRGVVIPDDDKYVFDERVMAQIPELATKALFNTPL